MQLDIEAVDNLGVISMWGKNKLHNGVLNWSPISLKSNTSEEWVEVNADCSPSPTTVCTSTFSFSLDSHTVDNYFIFDNYEDTQNYNADNCNEDDRMSEEPNIPNSVENHYCIDASAVSEHDKENIRSCNNKYNNNSNNGNQIPVNNNPLNVVNKSVLKQTPPPVPPRPSADVIARLQSRCNYSA